MHNTPNHCGSFGRTSLNVFLVGQRNNKRVLTEEIIRSL